MSYILSTIWIRGLLYDNSEFMLLLPLGSRQMLTSVTEHTKTCTISSTNTRRLRRAKAPRDSTLQIEPHSLQKGTIAWPRSAELIAYATQLLTRPSPHPAPLTLCRLLPSIALFLISHDIPHSGNAIQNPCIVIIHSSPSYSYPKSSSSTTDTRPSPPPSHSPPQTPPKTVNSPPPPRQNTSSTSSPCTTPASPQSGH